MRGRQVVPVIIMSETNTKSRDAERKVMLIINKIKEDQLQARKDRLKYLSSFLTTLLCEVSKTGLDDCKRESTDTEAIAVIKKFIKNSDEILENLEESDERFQNAKYEINILNNYLPRQLTSLELDHEIDTIIDAHGLDSIKGLGIIMKELNSKFLGLFNGKEASQIAKSKIG
jgi:uncharacterized protein YqeY